MTLPKIFVFKNEIPTEPLIEIQNCKLFEYFPRLEQGRVYSIGHNGRECICISDMKDMYFRLGSKIIKKNTVSGERTVCNADVLQWGAELRLSTLEYNKKKKAKKSPKKKVSKKKVA